VTEAFRKKFIEMKIRSKIQQNHSIQTTKYSTWRVEGTAVNRQHWIDFEEDQ
jgi:hypothetical protein